MAMAGADDSCCSDGERDLVVVRQKGRRGRDEFPWSAFLTQLQDRVSQAQRHVGHQFQARLQRKEGSWQVGQFRGQERQQIARVSLRGRRFAAIIPGDSVAETVITSGIFNFLNIYNTLLVTRLILTWFPDPPAIIANPLSTICDPYLNIFRGIIPPLGTLDLSPILAFLALNVFTSTAAALPAELPSNKGISQTPVDSQLTWRQRAQRKKGPKPVNAEEKSNE